MFEESTKLCDIKYKIVFLGQSGVGKTAIIDRFIKQNFHHPTPETVGIDFMVKNVNFQGKIYRLQLWDTAGQQKFKSLIPSYMRDAHCAVFVFDITNPQSFKAINGWYELFKQYHAKDSIAILAGNKTDLQLQRKITQSQGLQLSNRLNMNYCQVSAKNGEGVQHLFQCLIENIVVGKSSAQQIYIPTQRIIETMSVKQSGINKSKTVKLKKQKKKIFSCCN